MIKSQQIKANSCLRHGEGQRQLHRESGFTGRAIGKYALQNLLEIQKENVE